MDCFAHAALPNFGEIDNIDRGVLDALAAVRRGIFTIAVPESHDILILDQRAPALQVRYDRRTTSSGYGKFHRCHLTVRLRLRLIEVSVAVEEQQPVAPSPP